MTPMPRRACLDQYGLREWQAMDVGHIERDEHRIEVKPAHRFEKDGRVMVPGQAEKPDASLLARLDESLERAAAAEDQLQVVGGSQVVQLPKVEMVGTQPLEALVEQPERAVAGAVMGLGGEEDLAATLAQCGAIVVEAAGIGRSRVAVGHALIERTVDDGDGLGHAAVGAQHTFTAQGKLRHLAAGSAQRTAWDRRMGVFGLEPTW